MRPRRELPPPPLFSLALVVGALTVLPARPGGVAGQTRPFTASDMLDVVRISGDVAVSPAGHRLAFVLPDLTEEWNVLARRQVGSVHVLEWAEGAPAQPDPVGHSGQRTSFPAFSPDGTRLALFVEAEAAGVGAGSGTTDEPGGRLAVWDLGERAMSLVGEPFTGRPSMAPQWSSPTRIVYARPSAPEPQADPPRVEVLRTSDPLPGDAYFRREVRTGLVVVDLERSTGRTLVADDGAVTGFAVSPDGAHVTVREQGREGAALWSLPSSGPPARLGEVAGRPFWSRDGRLLLREGEALAALSPDRPASSPTLLAPLSGITSGVVASPRGTHLAGLRPDPTVTDPEIEPPRPGMYTIARPFMDVVVAAASDGTATNVTTDITDNVKAPVWSRDGGSVYFVAVDNATYDETLYRYDVDERRRVVLASGRESFDDLIPVAGGVLASVESATAPADLWHFEADDGQRTRVTRLNPQLAAFDFSEPALFHFDNRDGVRLGALLYRATGPLAGSDEPVVTYVYEKLTPGIHRFQPRHQIFATHGYAVLMPNVLIEVGAPGDSYVKAVVPAVEATRAMGFTNERTCMWGGSFGAYATSFVITQTDIFDCAVSRATPPELFRNWASGRDRDSDNIERGQARLGGSPFEVQDRYLSQSAFFHLDQVETPVLITHGRKDYTILFEEGAMMFYALRRLGKEAVFVAYREGDHSLYRHSRADALDVHERMLAWFAKYLRPDGGAGPS